jgi:crotonobetainyl-CoA:carnitine CoA-transferase CaiB-like acyl-CoA transferase
MLPLAGVRILAVEQYGAGPFGTLQLADLGAEIIKIENAGEGGDVGRHVRHPNDPLAKGDSLFFQAFNRNKRSITLNLKSGDGQAVFRKLAAGADAVFNNLRGDLPGKLGLTYDQLRDVNEQLVCVHLSAYGREGERAAWPGYDYLMQAECGYLSVTGEPGGPPSRMGLSLVDLSTGLQAAIALASGIIGARASGKGGDLDVSLFDAAMANVCYVAAWYLSMGEKVTREPRSAHPNLTPSQLYKTKDGWIFIMCNKEKFWPILC